MTTARTIITDALTVGLNKLSPGETLDADVAAVCLSTLGLIVDEINAVGNLLWREATYDSTAISAVSGTLGVDWPTLAPGINILGATVRYSASPNLDVEMDPLTVAQYSAIAIKTVGGIPTMYCYDGYETVYLYPKPSTARVVTLRARQQATAFADLDTDYGMPNGFRSYFAALLAERMAPSLLGTDLSPGAQRWVMAAKQRTASQTLQPAIIGGPVTPGPVARILRGY